VQHRDPPSTTVRLSDERAKNGRTIYSRPRACRSTRSSRRSPPRAGTSRRVPRDDDIEAISSSVFRSRTWRATAWPTSAHFCELTRSDAFKHEDRYNLGYGDGFVEQAYCMAVGTIGEREAALIASCGHSPAQARERVLAMFHEHVSVQAFLVAYTRCVKLGYAGLEPNR
jgi:hypothetical protein